MTIIDANNLAGNLGLLDKKNFDHLLIDIIKEYNQDRKQKIFLVFDSTDPMGDKFREDDIIVIYAPRDNYYRNADDKIIELAREAEDNHIIIITDDIEIKEKIKKLKLDLKLDLNLVTATDFVDNLKTSLEEEPDEKDLGDAQKEKINQELLNIWR